MCYLENPCYTGTFWLSPLKKSLKKPSKEPKSRFNSQISFLFIWAQVRYHNTREVATHKNPERTNATPVSPKGIPVSARRRSNAREACRGPVNPIRRVRSERQNRQR